MARTVSIVQRSVWNDHKAVIADVNITSYTNPGGESLTAADLGFGLDVDFLIPMDTAGRLVRYNISTSKLEAYEDGASLSGTLDEVPNATNVGTVRVLALGDGIV